MEQFPKLKDTESDQGKPKNRKINKVVVSVQNPEDMKSRVKDSDGDKR